jgi:hypothetical protein
MEHTTKAQTKNRLLLIVEKGNKYIMIHPKIDAYVPGAPGRYPIKPQVTIKRRHLFANLDMIMEFILNITCNPCRKPLFPSAYSKSTASCPTDYLPEHCLVFILAERQAT